MDPEELEPKQKAAPLKLLDPLSVDELENYILDLQGEIERVKDAIAKKQAIRSGADRLFRK